MVKLVYIGMVLALVGSMQLAYATNESLYNLASRLDLQSVMRACSSDCDNPSAHIDTPHYACGVISGVVTNTTACTDRYVHGFQTWCKTDKSADMNINDTRFAPY